MVSTACGFCSDCRATILQVAGRFSTINKGSEGLRDLGQETQKSKWDFGQHEAEVSFHNFHRAPVR